MRTWWYKHMVEDMAYLSHSPDSFLVTKKVFRFFNLTYYFVIMNHYFWYFWLKALAIKIIFKFQSNSVINKQANLKPIQRNFQHSTFQIIPWLWPVSVLTSTELAFITKAWSLKLVPFVSDTYFQISSSIKQNVYSLELWHSPETPTADLPMFIILLSLYWSFWSKLTPLFGGKL